MGRPPARRAAALSGPPAFRDRAEAGERLGARLREVLGETQQDHSERLRGSAPASSPAPGTAAPRAAAPGASGHRPVVLALPRGGVPVGAAVARALGVPLGILLVRKIGHPQAPELGLGAIVEDGPGGASEPYFDREMLARAGLRPADLAEVVARERAELARRAAVYAPRSPGAAPSGGPGLSPGADAGAPAGAGLGPREDLAGQLVVLADDGLATGVTARAALRAVRARGARRAILAVPVAAPEAVRALENETGEVVTLVTPRRFHSVGEWYVDFSQLTDSDVLAALRCEPPGN